MTARTPDQRALLGSVGVLGDESRWRLFSFIRRSRRAVTREEAAEKVGISRKLAAFHLDKMVAAGLLRARYDAVGEVPRVGRRPKVYEPVEQDIAVSIPGRQYQLLADLLLEALLAEESGSSRQDAATRAAHDRGLAAGAAVDAARGVGDAPEHGAAALPACTTLLEEHGYEPVLHSPAQVRLRNCPFHPLADKARSLVCGMNQAFLAGCLEGMQVHDVEARLEPVAGECCVRLTAQG